MCVHLLENKVGVEDRQGQIVWEVEEHKLYIESWWKKTHTDTSEPLYQRF